MMASWARPANSPQTLVAMVKVVPASGTNDGATSNCSIGSLRQVPSVASSWS
jgi:hypothetical protein